MHVLILGGGFCGARVAKTLENDVNVTLIDSNPQFEFTPSVLKCIFDPQYYKQIVVPFRQFLHSTRIITDNIISITPNSIKTKTASYTFDYLVISTGIEYPIFLTNKKDVYTVTSVNEAQNVHSAVLSADRILVVGGGLIGTELAGEIVTKIPEKEVILVHSHPRLLERNPFKASAYAHRFLEERRVKIVYNEKVRGNTNGSYTTDKGRSIEADVGLWCAGIRWDTSFMNHFKSSIFAENGALHVNEHLQLVGYPNIFVGGDITAIPEEKTAQNAERHADVIVENLRRAVEGTPLCVYTPRTGPLLISLGTWREIMTIKDHVITGVIPGILKHLVEWRVLGQYRGF